MTIKESRPALMRIEKFLSVMVGAFETRKKLLEDCSALYRGLNGYSVLVAEKETEIERMRERVAELEAMSLDDAATMGELRRRS